MQSSSPDKNIENIRHSLAHLLAAAVIKKFPKTKLGIGPTIENGFYYDFLFEKPISVEILPELEKDIRALIKQGLIFSGEKTTGPKAKTVFKGQPFKLELIKEFLKDKQPLTIYHTSVPATNYQLQTTHYFTDLCRGGHVKNTSEINPDAFRLTHLAGAYWKGNEKNPQLTRIYGVAFETKKELDEYLNMLDEAEKRNHKKLGKELDLFIFSELVGSGLPLWTPKGTLLRDTLDNFVWQLRQKRGYERVDIPHITRKELYEKSGHWDKFKDELFRITTREGHQFAMKPMNCPHHTQIYARRQWSYKELPQRYTSTTKCYRDEQSGELSGLSRVRSFTQDDAHVFCRISQIKDEIQKIWEIVHEFYESVGLKLKLRLSLRDPANPERYLGNRDHWEKAESILKEIAKNNKTEYFEAPGEASFYAPKLDFMATDSMGREWQVATIQLDVYMPQSFDLFCINERGEQERIVMIHAAIMGSIERFLSILIEHFAGAFPLWLSPVQVVIIPVSDKFNDYAKKVKEKLFNANIRVEVDDKNETLGKRIRENEMQKIPYIAIVGDKEINNNTLSVRRRGGKDEGAIDIDKFISRLQKEIEEKTL